MGLDAMGLGAIADFAGKVMDKFGPEDPGEKAAAKLEMLKAVQTGELAELAADTQLAQMQADVNKAEAGSTSVFVAGWRPFVGWVCGAGFAMVFVIGPMLEWIANLSGHAIKFPVLDTGTLSQLLIGMLGLGGLRTYEKVKGVEQSVH